MGQEGVKSTMDLFSASFHAAIATEFFGKIRGLGMGHLIELQPLDTADQKDAFLLIKQVFRLELSRSLRRPSFLASQF
jgi:hypothetical protein